MQRWWDNEHERDLVEKETCVQCEQWSNVRRRAARAKLLNANVLENTHVLWCSIRLAMLQNAKFGAIMNKEIERKLCVQQEQWANTRCRCYRYFVWTKCVCAVTSGWCTLGWRCYKCNADEIIKKMHLLEKRTCVYGQTLNVGVIQTVLGYCMGWEILTQLVSRHK